MSTKLVLVAAAFALLAVANASDVYVEFWPSTTHPGCTGSPLHADHVKITLGQCSCGMFIHTMKHACFKITDGSNAGSPYNFTSYPNNLYCLQNMTGSNPNVQTGECSTAVNGYSIKILGDATTTAPQGDATNSNDCSSSSEYCDPAPCQGTVSCGGPTTTTVTNSACKCSPAPSCTRADS